MIYTKIMKSAKLTTIPRHLDDIESLLSPNKVLVIYGPRRVGKTTILKKYLKTTKYSYRFDAGDDISTHEYLSSQKLSLLREYVDDNELIVIDEAQMIPKIGSNLKLLVDHFPNLRIIVTGSASFDLAQQIGEPLVGRKSDHILYPVAQSELSQDLSAMELKQNLKSYLIYGSYPDILTAGSKAKKIDLLKEITNSYLFKDILIFNDIKNAKFILDLLKLIALQMGSEISLNELGTKLGVDKQTVARYLELLEKTFILYNLRPYYVNQRKAISKKSKYYFYDLGIRNAVIGNFNSLDKRSDVGELWENFLVMERLKKQEYRGIYANNYFWRTWDQKEVDWVEMRDGKLFGYEFKWSEKKRTTNKKAWLASHPSGEAVFQVVDSGNYLDFVMKKK